MSGNQRCDKDRGLQGQIHGPDTGPVFFTIADILSFYWVRKWWLLLSFCLLMTCAVVYSFRYPTAYVECIISPGVVAYTSAGEEVQMLSDLGLLRWLKQENNMDTFLPEDDDGVYKSTLKYTKKPKIQGIFISIGADDYDRGLAYLEGLVQKVSMVPIELDERTKMKFQQFQLSLTQAKKKRDQLDTQINTTQALISAKTDRLNKIESVLPELLHKRAAATKNHDEIKSLLTKSTRQAETDRLGLLLESAQRERDFYSRRITDYENKAFELMTEIKRLDSSLMNLDLSHTSQMNLVELMTAKISLRSFAQATYPPLPLVDKKNLTRKKMLLFGMVSSVFASIFIVLIIDYLSRSRGQTPASVANQDNKQI